MSKKGDESVEKFKRLEIRKRLYTRYIRNKRRYIILYTVRNVISDDFAELKNNFRVLRGKGDLYHSLNYKPLYNELKH